MKTTSKITSAVMTGLLLALLGLPVIAMLTSNFPEQTRAIWGLALTWIVAIALLILVKYGEGRPYSSIGFSPITIKEGLLAIGIGIVLSISVPLLTLLASQFLPSAEDGSILDATVQNSWQMLLLGVLTAGITEEIIFRGYLIERLQELTGRPLIAVGVSVLAFALPHILNWNVTHVLGVVLPLGLILSWLYLWKRNILFNMIVHVVIDLPLVFIALAST
ncbi:MAG TPA: type II CAAX endopeptidase family protein [Anaerolineales bacterium]|nr:type II CAAX endopeptidase family protein [Anaerolineales bacterium]